MAEIHFEGCDISVSHPSLYHAINELHNPSQRVLSTTRNDSESLVKRPDEQHEYFQAH